MPESAESRASIIGVITAPLGFFALSLLIVEGFLTITVVFSNLDSRAKCLGMVIGAGLFVLVVGGVFVLVWNKPKNLTFGESGHLKSQELWGTSENPATSSDSVLKGVEPTASRPTPSITIST